MATIPSFNGLRVLFAFWGMSNILLFWAPLIRATREWAGKDEHAAAQWLSGLISVGSS